MRSCACVCLLRSSVLHSDRMRFSAVTNLQWVNACALLPPCGQEWNGRDGGCSNISVVRLAFTQQHKEHYIWTAHVTSLAFPLGLASTPTAERKHSILESKEWPQLMTTDN